jgi:sRNA-binding protein
MPKKKKAAKRKLTKKRAVKRKIVKRKVTKAAKRKPIKRSPVQKKPAVRKKPKENIIGKVTHYFPKVRAAVIKLKAPLATGDTIKIKGHTTDFKQCVVSLQIDRVPINLAQKGQEIGLLVDSRVRQNDIVTKA